MKTDAGADPVDVAGKIAGHVSPFAEIWRDDRGNIVALSAYARPDAALVVRSDADPTVFCDDNGNPGAVVGRGWAMVGPFVSLATAHGKTASFAGRVTRREIPAILEARGVSVAGQAAAHFFRTALGDGAVHDPGRPHGLARALTCGAGRAAVVYDLELPRCHFWRAVPLAVAAENARRMEAWGIPPPAEGGSALRAYATDLVRHRPWKPPFTDAPRGTREDLIAAIREWSRDLPTYHARDRDGRVWRLHDIRCHALRGACGIRAVAFPAVGAPPADRYARDLVAAPEDDIAICTQIRWAGRTFPGRGALPVLYAMLARSLREEPEEMKRVRTAAVALALAVARTRIEGPTVVLEGVQVTVRAPVPLASLQA